MARVTKRNAGDYKIFRNTHIKNNSQKEVSAVSFITWRFSSSYFPFSITASLFKSSKDATSHINSSWTVSCAFKKKTYRKKWNKCFLSWVIVPIKQKSKYIKWELCCNIFSAMIELEWSREWNMQDIKFPSSLVLILDYCFEFVFRRFSCSWNPIIGS